MFYNTYSPLKTYNQCRYYLQVGACIVNPSKQVIAIGGSSVENPEELEHRKIFTTVTSLPLTNPYGIIKIIENVIIKFMFCIWLYSSAC